VRQLSANIALINASVHLGKDIQNSIAEEGNAEDFLEEAADVSELIPSVEVQVPRLTFTKEATVPTEKLRTSMKKFFKTLIGRHFTSVFCHQLSLLNRNCV
jgi:hypothetical protein